MHDGAVNVDDDVGSAAADVYQDTADFPLVAAEHRVGACERLQDDLLDAAAIQSFIHEGTVYAVEPVEVPGGGPIAAVYRY